MPHQAQTTNETMRLISMMLEENNGTNNVFNSNAFDKHHLIEVCEIKHKIKNMLNVLAAMI